MTYRLYGVAISMSGS